MRSHVYIQIVQEGFNLPLMDGMQNKKQHIVRISQTSPSVGYTTQTSPLLEIVLIVL